MAFNVDIGTGLSILLGVLGLSSPYPSVEVSHMDVFRKDQAVVLQFNAGNLLNNSFKEMLDAGVTLNISYDGSTRVDGKPVYSIQHAILLSYNRQREYYIMSGGSRFNSFRDLNNAMITNRILVLTNTRQYSGKVMETLLTMTISSAEFPTLNELWGNKPIIRMRYNFKD